jgi:hypothetical protein
MLRTKHRPNRKEKKDNSKRLDPICGNIKCAKQKKTFEELFDKALSAKAEAGWRQSDTEGGLFFVCRKCCRVCHSICDGLTDDRCSSCASSRR